MGDGIETRAWRIRGRVQGVGFRWWTVQTGTGLGLSGRVWNEDDGSVVVHVRGGDAELERFREKLEVGPMMARVQEVESIEAEGPWPPSGIEVVR